MKLNWFSPLSATKTDLVNYTLPLLSELSKYADIVFWSDSTNWDKALEQYVQVKYYELNSISWEEINDADLNIYHLDNEPDSYSNIWKVSIQCSGVVILHNAKLHDFLLAIYQKQSVNKNEYLQQIRDYYGQEINEIAEEFWEGKRSTEFMEERYPLSDFIMNRAIAVITHSQELYDNWSTKNRSLIGYIDLSKNFSESSNKQQKSEKIETFEVYARDIFEFTQEAIKFKSYPLKNYLIKKISKKIIDLKAYNLSKKQIETMAKAIEYIIQ